MKVWECIGEEYPREDIGLYRSGYPRVGMDLFRSVCPVPRVGMRLYRSPYSLYPGVYEAPNPQMCQFTTF